MPPPPLVTFPERDDSYCDPGGVITLRVAVHMLAVYGCDQQLWNELDAAARAMNIFTVRDILRKNVSDLDGVVSAVTCSLLRGLYEIRAHVPVDDFDILDAPDFTDYCVTTRPSRRVRAALSTDGRGNLTIQPTTYTKKTAAGMTVKIVCVSDGHSAVTYDRSIFANTSRPDAPPYVWCLPATIVTEDVMGCPLDYGALGRFLSFINHTNAVVRVPQIDVKRHAQMCGAIKPACKKLIKKRDPLVFYMATQSFLCHWLYVGTGIPGAMQLFTALWHTKNPDLVTRCFRAYDARKSIYVTGPSFEKAVHATHAIKMLVRTRNGNSLVGEKKNVLQSERGLCGIHIQKDDLVVIETANAEDAIPLHAIYTQFPDQRHEHKCTSCFEMIAGTKKRSLIYMAFESRALMTYALSYSSEQSGGDYPAWTRDIGDWHEPPSRDDAQTSAEKQLEAFERPYFLTASCRNLSYDHHVDRTAGCGGDATMDVHTVSHAGSPKSVAAVSNKVTNVLTSHEGYSHAHCHMRHFIRSRWRTRNPVATYTNFVRGNPKAATSAFNINYRGGKLALTRLLAPLCKFLKRKRRVRYLLPVSINNANSTMYAMGVENVGLVFDALGKRGGGRKLARFPAIELMLRFDAKKHGVLLRLSPKNVCPHDPSRNTAVYAAYVHGRLSVNMQRNFADTLPQCQEQVWQSLLGSGAVIDRVKNTMLCALERRNRGHLPRPTRLFLECLMEACRIYMSDEHRKAFSLLFTKGIVTWTA